MRVVARILRWFGAALGAVILIVLLAFALVQTVPGRAWLEKTAAAVASNANMRVSIAGLRGLVPFRFTLARIALADSAGTYATLRDVGFDMRAAALFGGRLRIRALTIGELDVARPSVAKSTTPLVDSLRVPHLPIAVALDRISIGRLVLGAPLLGERVVATLAGHAAITNGHAEAGLDLHRIDGQPGNLTLTMSLAGATPRLALHLAANEPSGLLSDRLFRRSDHLPLRLALDGEGPIADWHGRLAASAGPGARVAVALLLALRHETTLGLSGTAALLPLLPAEFGPILGQRIAFSLRVQRTNDRLVLDRLAVTAAGGSLTARASLAGPRIAAKLRLQIPQLSRLAGFAATAVEGSAAIDATIAGDEHRPRVAATLSGNGVRFEGYTAPRLTANLTATPAGDLGNPQSRIAIAAKGRIERLGIPAGFALGPGLGRDIDWSLAAGTTRDLSTVDLERLAVDGFGLSLGVTGRMAQNGRAMTGRARLSVADLRPFSQLAGRSIAGSLALDGEAQPLPGTAGVAASFMGNAKDLRTGIPAADALLGGRVGLTGSLRRNADGVLTLDKLALAGADVKFSADGHFDPGSRHLAAAGSAEVPRLQPLDAALGGNFAGSVSLRTSVDGTLDHLSLDADAKGRALAIDGTRIDAVQLTAAVADLAAPKATLNGRFRSAGLDGTLAVAAQLRGRSELAVPRLRFAAAGGVIDGTLTLALDTGLVAGRLDGRIPNFAAWSRLAGVPLAGSARFTAGLAARGGQAVDFRMTGDGLAFGAGAGRSAVGHVDAQVRLAGLGREPSGTGRLALTGFRSGRLGFTAANFAFDSERPGRFAFRGGANGKILSLAFAGDAGRERGGVGLSLARLDARIAGESLRLEQPLVLSRHGNDLAFSGLALAFGSGRIAGSGSLRGQSLALNATADNLPLMPAGRFLGHPGLQGALSFSVTGGGTLAAPRAHLAAATRGLAFAQPIGAHPPILGLSLTGDWNGRSLTLDGRVTGLAGDRIGFGGDVPLLLRRRPFGISVPSDGRIALRLQGSGEIGHLADLLPIGEDRLGGKFAVDLSVDGTVATPAASGRASLTDGRYENFASGAVLTKINAVLTGNRDRLTLTSFSAADSAAGKISGQGSIVLNGTAGKGGSTPTADLAVSLHDFRLAARDEALVTASGNVAVTGPLTAPQVKAALTIGRADINLPNSLPPNIVVIPVVRIDSQTGKPIQPLQQASAPVFPVALDIGLDMPGQVFVRGHGLDSEWRGRLKVTGTTAEPRIAGALRAVHGTFDILGKSFRVTRGLITFAGGAKPDPLLDINSEVAASDVTAQITIGGLASAPKIALTSTPPLPQDEILSRVLFNQGTGQITAAQGLALAQAAATLTGSGPGVLDRLRGNLGLDWLRLGQAGAGPSSGVVNANPNPNNPSSTSGTAISAGKYIANGVSVGVTQGVSPPTSQVTVEVQLGHHLTLDTSAGQNGGTGVGLGYNFDY